MSWWAWALIAYAAVLTVVVAWMWANGKSAEAPKPPIRKVELRLIRGEKEEDE